jgi:glycosyltransferase involved in cell wall biosynthesis
VKICLVSNQIAAFDKIGGFGTATRALGRGLVRRGARVFAVVPRRAGQRAVEEVDGITVHATGPFETFTSGAVFREIGADLYHSQEPTFATRVAEQAMPGVPHLVTCRDPRGLAEHFVEWRYSGLRRRLQAPVTWLYEASPFVKQAVRRATRVFSAAPFLRERVRRLYGVESEFLPSPVRVPTGVAPKSENPLVLFVGRFDRRKRVERFFDLARQCPSVRFVAVGRSHEASYDRRLREVARAIPNLEVPGFLSLFDTQQLERYYEAAWILVNTSVREGLPYTFLEAAAHGCAVLSGLDPDGFVGRFGMIAGDDGLASGLRSLLEGGQWRVRGDLGRAYVAETFAEERSLDHHLRIYEEVRHGRRA